MFLSWRFASRIIKPLATDLYLRTDLNKLAFVEQITRSATHALPLHTLRLQDTLASVLRRIARGDIARLI